MLGMRLIETGNLQAMMEHGAVTCTQAPKCGECPIRGHCAAYADVLRHVEDGGSPADAPPVTRYPTKVNDAFNASVR